MGPAGGKKRKVSGGEGGPKAKVPKVGPKRKKNSAVVGEPARTITKGIKQGEHIKVYIKALYLRICFNWNDQDSNICLICQT
jgi:hypothetical protein